MKNLKEILIGTAIVASIATGIYLAYEKVSPECKYDFNRCYEELIDTKNYLNPNHQKTYKSPKLINFNNSNIKLDYS